MKKIIYKKLLSDCLIFSLIGLFGISSIIWVFQAVNFLDIIIEDGRNYNIYFLYSLLNFPKIISKVLPFCIFFGFSYIFIKYEIKNELIIYWSYGIEKFSLINFFLFFSILILILQILLLSIIVPKSQEMARSLLRSSDVDYFEGLIKPRKFNDNIKDLTIFAEDKNSEDEFTNIYIKKKTSEDNFQITFAKKGVFEERGKDKILVLYEGQNLNNNNDKITNFSFSKSDFGLGDMKSHLNVYLKIQEQTSLMLFECAKNIILKENKKITFCNQNKPRDTYKELFKRFFVPLYLPLLILISSINLLITKENVNYNKFRFSIFLIGIFAIVMSESSLGFIENSFFYNFIFVLLPILSFIILYSVLFFKFKINTYKFKL